MEELIGFTTLRDDITKIFNLCNTEGIQSYSDIKDVLNKISEIDNAAMEKVEELVDILQSK